MNPTTGILVLLVIGVAAGCSDSNVVPEGFSPASENECNVSCSFDRTKDQQCFENAAVLDYLMNDLLLTKTSEIASFLEINPLGACFCGVALLAEDGKFRSITVKKTTSVNMGNAIVKKLLLSDPVPIPETALCIVGKKIPLSFNNFER